MLVDEVKIHLRAGHGGAGRVAFLRIKGSKGVAGGDGGRGGSVYAEGVSDLSALRQYRFKKDFYAGDGVDGKGNNQAGPDGKDLLLKVPIGTVIYNHTANTNQEITEVGIKVLIAKGGLGGRGNSWFKSARRTTPMYAQSGLPGEECRVTLELQLIADVGLIGFPNAGKSSLLNELTKAAVKVANYPFTTLEPNLGVFYPEKVLKGSDAVQAQARGLIIADIPGLIEGASTGKGLGHQFLRHINRTKVLIHCVPADGENLVSDYKIIRKELAAHDPALAEKDEYVFLTKTDLIEKAEVKKKLTALKKLNKKVLAVSIHDQDSLDAVQKLFNGLIDA